MFVLLFSTCFFYRDWFASRPRKLSRSPERPRQSTWTWDSIKSLDLKLPFSGASFFGSFLEEFDLEREAGSVQFLDAVEEWEEWVGCSLQSDTGPAKTCTYHADWSAGAEDLIWHGPLRFLPIWQMLTVLHCPMSSFMYIFNCLFLAAYGIRIHLLWRGRGISDNYHPMYQWHHDEIFLKSGSPTQSMPTCTSRCLQPRGILFHNW